ncbi:MAG: HD domain-containing protein, partial [Clostridia bacterium]|nr:HD domain-containing protein [Clostridia bacterium]
MKDIMKNYHTFDELIKLINASGKAYNIELINKAYDVAYNAHKGQKRVSGLDYIYHPISVAYILVEMGMDSASVVAAILHDVIEDTKVTQNDLKQMFGKEIATLVEGVTKFKKIPSSSREEQQAEDIKKVLRATSHDLRVIMIKLADRLQNMRTIDCMDMQKKREK